MSQSKVEEVSNEQLLDETHEDINSPEDNTTPLDLENLPDGVKEELAKNPELSKTLVALSQKRETYQSNFPHPKHLREYCDMYPDAAKIIFEEYKEVGISRRNQEMIGLKGAIKFDSRAQWLGFFLPIILIITGLYSMHQGWEKTAIAIFLLGASPIIRSFFNSPESKKKSEDE